jgi:O-antigen ligase/tetratricopeptide (TPR) repeat protein
MTTSFASPLRRVFLWVLCATAILPLVVFKGLAHPFETPREIVFRVLMALLAPVACLVWLREGGARRLGFLGWSVVAVLVTGLLSTIFSVDPGTSFWGFAERLTGFLTLALCIFFGTALRLLFRDVKARFRFLCVWLGAWGIVTVWAIIEFFAPGYWSQFHGGEQRVVATIGNPIFLAGGLLLATGTTGTALLSSKPFRYRVPVAVLAVCAGILAIFFTQTRGAYVGLAVGAVVGGIALAFWTSDRWLRAVGVGIPLVVCVGVLFLFFFRETATVRYFSPLYRAASVFSLTTNDASRIQRFQLWRVAMAAVAARPLVGWGLENFDTALDRLYDPAITRYGVANSVSDRAHNAYLDTAVVAGIPGMLAYLSFLTALVALIVRARRLRRMPGPAAALAIGSLVAYAISNVTAFDTHATYFGLTVAAATLSSLVTTGDMNALPKKNVVPEWFVVVPVCGVSLLLFVCGVIPLARGSALVHETIFAENSAQLLDAAKTLPTFWNPYRAHQAQRIANEIFKAVGNALPRGRDAEPLLKAAESMMRDAIHARPNNFSVRFTLANIVTLQVTRGYRPTADALALLEEARLLAPLRQITDFQVGNLLLVEQKPDEAVAVFERALALDTSVAEAHWHLARGLAAAGNEQRAAEEFHTALLGGFGEQRPGQEYAVAINALLSRHVLTDVYQLYERWTVVEPENANVFASYAVAAVQTGHVEEAIAALQRAVALDPTLQRDAAAFIEEYHLSGTALPPEE